MGSLHRPSAPGNPGTKQQADPGRPPKPSDRQIAAWLALFFEPGHAVELRAPKSTRPGRKGLANVVRRFPASDLLAVAREGIRLSARAPGVYFLLNGIKPALLDEPAPKRGATAADVPRRRWLPIDCDPTRPADTSATDAEKAEAKALMLAVRAYLDAAGWPAPIVADSGNGYHLVYRIDLPTEDDGLVKAVLTALAERFDTAGCKIDRKVFDPPRLVKLYGTQTRKGEATASRPHRYSAVLDGPLEPAVVGVEALRAVAGPPVQSEPAAPALDLADEIERSQAPSANGRPRDNRPDAEARAVAYLERCEPAVSGQGGHDTTFKTACKIGPGFDLPRETTYRLLAQHYNARCEPPWNEQELRHKVDSAYQAETRRGWLLKSDRSRPSSRRNGRQSPAEAPAAIGDAEKRDDRTVDIKITADLHESVDQAAAALVSHPDVYERSVSLVEVVRQEKDDPPDAKGVKRSAGAPLIVALNKVTARTLVSRLARFWAYDRRAKGWVRKAPPRDVAEAVIGLKRYAGARPLCGISECPTLRPDGSLLNVPGYDPATGLLYLPSATFPPVPEEPSAVEVKAATAELLRLVTDFPFKADTDLAAWLAFVLTLVARGAIAGPVPGFLFSANVAGSGKSNLVTVASKIATGRAPAFDGYAADDGEMEKRLSAVAITADPLLLLDNAANGSAIGGPALDRAILCEGAFRARLLGKSEMTPDVPWRTVIALTGNNLSTRDDALRRFLPCFLLSPLEHPETRDPEDYAITKQSGLSLGEYVLRERPRLVVAALTILRGYVTDGRPKGTTAEGKPLTPMDFGAWDALIRQAVFFATGVDPAGSRETLQANDETTLERHRVVLAWKGLCLALNRLDGLTAREAAEEINSAFDSDRFKDVLEAFPKAVDPRNRRVDSAKLGYALRRHRDAVTPYGTLVSGGTDHSAILWGIKDL